MRANDVQRVICYSMKYMLRYIYPGVIIASVVFLILLGVGYFSGYRIGPGITLVKTHTLTITNLPNGATVFTDYATRGTTSTSTMKVSLVPGTHTVLISANDYWPFSTIVTVPENANATVRVFMVPKTVAGTILHGKEASAAKKLVAKQTLPTAKDPLIMGNGCALISVTAMRQIIATPTTTPSCTPPPFLCIDSNGKCATTIIFSPTQKPTDVLPYPGRQDALLISIGKTIYAFSLDPRNQPHGVPVLSGISPRMALTAKGTVVVVDQSTAYQLTL